MADFYGSDFAGADDIDEELSVREGEAEELYALAESVARRLSTPRGGLWFAPNEGFDIRTLVGSTEDVDQASDKIESECRKEERVRKAKCEITVVDRESWQVKLTCTPKVGTTFALTLSVSRVTVQLLKVGST